MSRPKHILRKTAVFFLVEPSEIEGFTEAVEWLESLLNEDCDLVTEDGCDVVVERRQRIAQVGGLKIEVYPNEHAPPHFHAISPHVNASFTIEDCALLNGSVGSKDLRKIQHWHRQFKPLLIERWNDTRPTDCKVGSYRERVADKDG